MLESLFNKFAALKPCNFINKRLQHSCFPVKFAKFLSFNTFFNKIPPDVSIGVSEQLFTQAD